MKDKKKISDEDKLEDQRSQYRKKKKKKKDILEPAKIP